MIQFAKRIKARLLDVKYGLNLFFIKLTEAPQYGIVKGYNHRKDDYHFDDTANTDHWQKEVYLKAKEILDREQLNRIIDFGCGSGYKLMTYLGNYNTLGIEISPTYEFLKNKYPEANWLNFNELSRETLTANVVVCSDVIEHVANPDELLANLKTIKDVTYYIISTPDRSLIPQKQHGPPLNKTHMREWNFSEFNVYINQHLEVLEHYISNKNQATQVVIAKLK
jgi:SAM-dependent methyltransferase